MTTEAKGIAWDLDPLVPSGADAAVAMGQGALSQATALAAEHRGKITGYDAAALRQALEQLERLQLDLTAAYRLRVAAL